MTRFTALMAAVLAAIFALGPARAVAEGFSVQPTLIETTTGGITVLTVTNTSDRRIYIEAKASNWTETADGAQSLTPAGPEVIVTPPATWVPPGSKYQVRVSLPPPPDKGEKAWRVELTQIPAREDLAANRINLALAVSLPAFSTSPSAAAPDLSARLVSPQVIEFRNDGGRRVRLADISQNGRPLRKGLAGYALSHSAVRVELGAAATRGEVSVETDLGTRKLTLR